MSRKFIGARFLSYLFISLQILISPSLLLADQIVLYTVPSPFGIDWRSPHTLLKSVLQNQNSGEAHEIGHVVVGLYCSNLGMSGNPDVLTGMTSAVDNSRQLLLREGYGLGLLFHNFEGRLNTWDEVTRDINDGVRSGRLSFMAFDISNATCQRLLDYEMEYRQRGYDRNYGLPNRPLHGEGAGCSAFGVSFLEVAGADLNLFFGRWGRYLEAPQRLVGGPMTGFFIPLARILLNPFAHWARAGEPYYSLSFWDPDRMHQYVQSLSQGAAGRTPYPSELLRWGKAKGIRMNLLGIPTPVGPIFRN